MFLNRYMLLRQADGGGNAGGPEGSANTGTGGGLPLQGPASQPAPPIASADQAFQTAFDQSAGRQAPRQQQPGTESTEDRYTRLMNTVEDLTSRRAGQDRRITDYEQRFTRLEDAINQLTTALNGRGDGSGQSSPQAQGDARQVQQQTPPTPNDDRYDELMLELTEMRAREARRDAIRQVSRDFPNIDLWAWEDNVPLGTDVAAMTNEVRALAERVQGLTGQSASQAASQTRQQLTQGMTPGSSPAPPQSQEDQSVARIQELWGIMNDTERFASMTARERDQISAEFDELSVNYGHMVSQNLTHGWASNNDLARQVGQIQAQLAQLGLQLPGQSQSLPTAL